MSEEEQYTTVNENTVLSAVFNNEKMGFREIFPNYISNPNTAQEIIAELIKKELLQQEHTKWNRGQKKIYSLTEKGKLHCLQLDVTNIIESLKRLQSSSSWLKNHPSQITKEINEQTDSVFHMNFAGKKETPELNKEFFIKMRAPSMPLLNIFLNVHEVIRQEFVNGYDETLNLKTMVTVIKDGVLYLVKPEDLENNKLITVPI